MQISEIIQINTKHHLDWTSCICGGRKGNVEGMYMACHTRFYLIDIHVPHLNCKTFSLLSHSGQFLLPSSQCQIVLKGTLAQLPNRSCGRQLGRE